MELYRTFITSSGIQRFRTRVWASASSLRSRGEVFHPVKAVRSLYSKLGKARGKAAAEVLARETEHSTLGADRYRQDIVRNLYSKLGRPEVRQQLRYW